MSAFESRIESAQALAALDRAERAATHLGPLMEAIAAELEDQAEANLAAEGRPKWKKLSDTTTELRKKQGKWPGRMLQVSGALARAIIGEADGDTAVIGVGHDVPYAAMQQFGGKKADFPKLWGDIPARPYLPFTLDDAGAAQLQPQAEKAILALADAHMRRALR